MEPIKLRFFKQKERHTVVHNTGMELKASERLLTLLDGLLNGKRTACSISPDRMGKMGWNNHNKLL